METDPSSRIPRHRKVESMQPSEGAQPSQSLDIAEIKRLKRQRLAMATPEQIARAKARKKLALYTSTQESISATPDELQKSLQKRKLSTMTPTKGKSISPGPPLWPISASTPQVPASQQVPSRSETSELSKGSDRVCSTPTSITDAGNINDQSLVASLAKEVGISHSEPELSMENLSRSSQTTAAFDKVRLLADKVLARGSLQVKPFTQIIHDNRYAGPDHVPKGEPLELRAFWLAVHRLCPILGRIEVLECLKSAYPVVEEIPIESASSLPEPRDDTSTKSDTITNSKTPTSTGDQVQPISILSHPPADDPVLSPTEASTPPPDRRLTRSRKFPPKSPTVRNFELRDSTTKKPRPTVSPKKFPPKALSAQESSRKSKKPRGSLEKSKISEKSSLTGVSTEGTPVNYRSGKLSAEELTVIERAVEEYEDAHSLSREEFASLIHSSRRSCKRADYWDSLIFCIPERNPKNVREAIKKLYLPFTRASFTEEEKLKLTNLVGEYGRDWKKIADTMGRYREHCQHMYRRIEEMQRCPDPKHGDWDDSETSNFNKAVASFSEDRDTIDWQQVSEAVGTRTPTQCLDHYRVRYRSDQTYQRQPR